MRSSAKIESAHTDAPQSFQWPSGPGPVHLALTKKKETKTKIKSKWQTSSVEFSRACDPVKIFGAMPSHAIPKRTINQSTSTWYFCCKEWEIGRNWATAGDVRWTGECACGECSAGFFGCRRTGLFCAGRFGLSILQMPCHFFFTLWLLHLAGQARDLINEKIRLRLLLF